MGDKPFTVKERRRLSRQYGYGHRARNNWGSGDLPAPFAEGDLVYLAEPFEDDRRMRDLGAGYFVVTCGFSVAEGDGWYFRVGNGSDRNSDRLHVFYEQRCEFGDVEDTDYMAAFQLIDTADPEGLAERERLLAAGWQLTTPLVCPTCGGSGRVPRSVSLEGETE